jgi:hemerythrin
MILENIKVGDTFSTENKLLCNVGFEKTKSLHTKIHRLKN